MGEAYSLHPLLRETENGWIDVINPFKEILLFAVFFKCGGPEFSQIIMSTSFVDLYREDIRPRNQRNEEDIHTDKRENYPTVSWRIQHPQGFYAKEWSEDKQEEDDCQAPDELQKISNMVFRNGVQEIPPVKDGVLSSPRVQHQGGGCSVLDEHGHVENYGEG